MDGVEVPSTVLTAGSVARMIPVVFLFYLAERFLTEGLTSGAEWNRGEEYHGWQQRPGARQVICWS